MNEIKSLNQELDASRESLESVISELSSRESFLCTGNACGAQASGI